MLVRDGIIAVSETLTQSERKLATAILSDYPFAGLQSIQELAKRADVSAPSITRFMTKIGLSGYQEFQKRLISELKAGSRSPIDVYESGSPIEGGYLGEFIERATTQMRSATEAITDGQFQPDLPAFIGSQTGCLCAGGADQ